MIVAMLTNDPIHCFFSYAFNKMRYYWNWIWNNNLKKKYILFSIVQGVKMIYNSESKIDMTCFMINCFKRLKRRDMGWFLELV